MASSPRPLNTYNELREKYSRLKELALKVKADLEERVKGLHGVAEDDEEKKNCWYLDKCVNVLSVHEKLLDNRMGSSFKQNDNLEGIVKEMQMFSDLLREIDAKTTKMSL